MVKIILEAQLDSITFKAEVLMVEQELLTITECFSWLPDFRRVGVHI
jgi:hypothetical protein